MKGSVLIVDDDRTFRFAMGKALRRLGFSVEEAESAEAALAPLSRPQAPDVVLLDLRMAGMGGLELLRRRISARSRFVVLTGHGTVQAAVEAMKLGAFSFLESRSTPRCSRRCCRKPSPTNAARAAPMPATTCRR